MSRSNQENRPSLLKSLERMGRSNLYSDCLATPHRPSLRKHVNENDESVTQIRIRFYLFVLPALRLMGGYPRQKCQPPRIKVQVFVNDTINDSVDDIL